jgi:hypothetical protein
MSGKVQVFRNGVSSGEVAAEVTNGFLALRAFSIASQKQIAEGEGRQRQSREGCSGLCARDRQGGR